jgi:DNA repair exonuclease SbcCD nuclease subunit
MNKWKYSSNGLQKDAIFKFKRVFSGHYHSKSIEKHSNGELIYVGTPYQLDRGDSGEEKGFHIIDLETDTYEFIENEKSIKYISLLYPSKDDFNKIQGNVVDIVVEGNVDTDELAQYQEEVNKLKPILPALLKTTAQSYSGVVEVEELNIKPLGEMFSEYIGSLDIEDDLKKSVEEELNSLYAESGKDI